MNNTFISAILDWCPAFKALRDTAPVGQYRGHYYISNFDPVADTVSKIRGVAFGGPSHLKVLFDT